MRPPILRERAGGSDARAASAGTDWDEGEIVKDPDDLEIARDALVAGDYPHAAHHIASALATQPDNPESIALFDALVARAGRDALDLFPLSPPPEPTYVGIHAARARLLFAQGYENANEAIKIVLDVALAMGNAAFLSWIETWLADDRVVAALDPHSFQRWALRVPGGPRGSNSPAERTIPLIARVAAARPECGQAAYYYGILLRKADRPGEAVEVGLRAYQLAPSWQTAHGVAVALGVCGRVDEAVSWYESAFAHGDALSGLGNDAGDLLLSAGRFAEAVDWYRRALSFDATDAWALPSMLYAAHRADPTAGHDRDLRKLAAQGNNTRARDLSLRLYQERT
jgi:tetratricopeptide (TPR) repeat protein